MLEKPEQASFFEQPIREPVLACEDNLSFMERLPDGQMKLVVTSPPYNLGKRLSRTRPHVDAYIESQERVISECVRVLHPQGSICWQVGNYVENGEIVPLDAVLYPVFRAQGLKLRNRIVWHFGHGLHCTSQGFPAGTKRLTGGRSATTTRGTLTRSGSRPSTPASVSFKGPNVGKLSGNPKGKNPSRCYGSSRTSRATTRRRTIHPCQFPVELVERLVLSMTNPNDAVNRPIHGSRLVRHRRAHARPHGLRLRHSEPST